MPWTTLITVDELADHLDSCVVVDCRHSLADPQAGRHAWEQAHIPGAYFLHMDTDLAGPRTRHSGRHPLPDLAVLRAKLAALGLGEQTQLVAYDDAGGAMAGRLWWLARAIGHEAAAVLDGGLPAWQAAGHSLASGVTEPPAAAAPGHHAPLAHGVELATIEDGLAHGGLLLVDARAAERYRGETEPLDPVAGHIPGALNRPLALNLQPDGRFLPAATLRAAFDELLAGRTPETVVHTCGSGVSACHNILAMEYAGLHGSRLYPGSWSQWCSDPARPVARGTAPGGG